MARLARLAIGGQAHHIIQRAQVGQVAFPDVADKVFFLECLGQACRAHRVSVHAYVLMEDHFHLLATPVEAPALSKMMQALGRAYVRYYNDRYRRRGTIWEGRYRSTVIQATRYTLPCMVLIDMNPVHSALASRATDYPWSSYGHYAGVRSDPILTPPAPYWALGNTPFAREAAYAQLVETGLLASERQRIADSALRGWALGDAEFVAQMQSSTARRVVKGRPGRPTSSRT